ncbi:MULTISPECIES: hypothetical protein [unclassified Streptomyces]|uniref:hypothetical protein n=1 Tax=unclassified Streptomyces TaxID=2593676 RepID=UPI003633E6B1
MKTCRRFGTIRTQFEREIGYMTAHSRRHEGRPAAKASAQQASSARTRMARALNSHVERCPECG